MRQKNNPAFKAIAKAIKKGRKFFVAGHQNPDGDSLGSTLAVCSYLRRMGKEVYPFSSDRPGEDLFFMPGIDTVNFSVLPDEFDFDTMILLECSDKNRGGNLEPLFNTVKTVINIDHHITGENYGTVNYINAKASSTAEIITEFFEYVKTDITPDEATCLYTGLVTDTGRFLHSNTGAESLRVGAVLLAHGADIQKVNTVIYNTKPYKELKLLGRALEKLNLLNSGTFAEITLAARDFELLGVDPRHTQGIVSQPIMIPSVEVSVLLREEPGRIAVNLRSKGRIDVSKIAVLFGGGGHARAAGFKVEGAKLEEIKTRLTASVIKEISKLQ
ncbi:MAG: bifunctional oligoribonuclease/PAP phosphatase NrnA [Elusimicrobia bacterium]|nr:bifunctional oligoribonuclease/PAP phosphatase NrnA [Elusimicrobiota bacterium]